MIHDTASYIIDGIFLKSLTVKLISSSMSLWQFHVPRWHVVVAVEVVIGVVGFRAPATWRVYTVQSGPPGMYNSIATPKTKKILNFNQSSLLHILDPDIEKVSKCLGHWDHPPQEPCASSSRSIAGPVMPPDDTWTNLKTLDVWTFQKISLIITVTASLLDASSFYLRMLPNHSRVRIGLIL